MTPADPVALFVALCVARAKHHRSGDHDSSGVETARLAAFRCSALCVTVYGGNDAAWMASASLLGSVGICFGVSTPEKDSALAELKARFPGIGAAALAALPARQMK